MYNELVSQCIIPKPENSYVTGSYTISADTSSAPAALYIYSFTSFASGRIL